MDTAGIREAGGRIETLGIERSYQAMADADLTLVVVDLSEPAPAEDRDLLLEATRQGRVILVGNKCDLPRRADAAEDLLAVSALTGEGIAELRRKIVDQIAPEEGIVPEAGFITSVRHEQRLRESVACLDKARSAAAGGVPHEMLLIDLYEALAALASITGAATADDILNRIFSTFCIGK